MIRVLPLFASVAMVTFSGGSALGFTLVGSELRLRTQGQLSSTSQLFVTSFPASAIVSDSTVEFPNVASLFDRSAGVPPGFARSLVDVSIDAGADYLAIDFDNAGFGQFATGFQNTYVFTFTAPTALQITDVLIDPQTTLGLTPNRVTFNGNELFVNVQGLPFNRNSFARINLSGTTVPDSGGVTVPEPSSVLSLGIVALAGTIFNRRTKSKALQ
ncbi:PEP-CTERM sorting domain-containing protein [Microseira sp. BLCC-F43]|uniref:PEP-CTERM sorting domain-containing protein n=1 Tax=Microseira sp. BLCC-F43 TaxID=3153602 RepID=UPI0035B9C29E